MGDVTIRAAEGGPYRQDPDRWREQLRRATENLERLQRKLATDPTSSRAADWQKRIAALEQSIAEYKQALARSDPRVAALIAQIAQEG